LQSLKGCKFHLCVWQRTGLTPFSRTTQLSAIMRLEVSYGEKETVQRRVQTTGTKKGE
jgi:hypothetical protein